MDVLGIRFCKVTPDADALLAFLGPDGVGLPPRAMEQHADFPGGILEAGDSWVEVWKDGPQMPAGTMLQIVVRDADAWAAAARTRGLDPKGPMDAHGERIYHLMAPGGLPVTVQSALPA